MPTVLPRNNQEVDSTAPEAILSPDTGPHAWGAMTAAVGYAAFTLIEMLVAIALMAIALTITFGTFYSVSKAWQRGLAMSDRLNHGEYVMQQLACGLRSAFVPVSTGKHYGYGFTLEDHGEGIGARDSISWVKTGGSLLNGEDPLTAAPHRIKVTIENDEDDRSAVAVRAWRPYANPDNFNPDSLTPEFISETILGFNCRVSTNWNDRGWEWEDRWENEATNYLPMVVELTLYVEPIEKGDDPIEMKRLIEIPVGSWSWISQKQKSK